jgi:hypothetical protein
MGGHPSRARSPRIITRVIVFLLLIVAGAIVNVAVAWGCALWVDVSASLPDALITDTNDGFWAVASMASHGTRVVFSQHVKSGETGLHGSSDPSTLVPGWAPLQQPTSEFVSLPIPAVEHRIVNGRGWPRVSLWCERLEVVGPDAVDSPPPDLPPLLGGIETGLTWKTGVPRDLPLRPIWPGFAINTLFYAGLLWLLFAAPFALRRRFRGGRIKRGLCPACAYPVGDTTVCTECGKAVSLSLRERAGVRASPS